jgi:glucose/mannose-6-phosphate isomerase
MSLISGYFEDLLKYDTQNMFEVLKNFPNQVREACEIGKNCPLFNEYNEPTQIVILGMGGSAIGGDLLRSYGASLDGAGHLSIIVNRNYTLPKFVNENTYIIANSYSGNTEETLSGFTEALKKTKHIISICSGGELERESIENNIPVIKIPGGLQPRCALGYSFFPLLYLMMRIGAFKNEAIETTNKAIEELLPMLDDASEKLSELSDDNPAISLAERFSGNIPVFYSASKRLDMVNLRWRCQIQENAKQAAFGNQLPEMNHNEINAWSFPEEIKKIGVPVFLLDPEDHPRVKMRFDALYDIFTEMDYHVYTLISEAKYLLTRMFNLTYMADWTSYYLALINNVDPTPIPLINKLKDYLSGKS